MAEVESYAGSCHCGQVKYSFSLSPPIEEQEVVQCNCLSLWIRAGPPLFLHIIALNVRTIPGVEIESLKIKKMDGKSATIDRER
ncbi:hypothetical protein ABOM_006640 [Aspergillus bombycis]|uniref:CENP-V/GFA domain-containing protein n=1 Tax=Aspergillus bombycis TaxID=109264 RepID=A0A1F8A098_9EURO|nr:hypothetical protein ABOM_006640 [Aspergillus bombycis]OGM45136.1 hypothetical protein ABOM_006640 [Aspergillus bombycis]